MRIPALALSAHDPGGRCRKGWACAALDPGSRCAGEHRGAPSAPQGPAQAPAAAPPPWGPVPPHTPSCLSLLPTLLSMKDNYLFLKEVKNLVEKTNCELKVCFQYMNRGDRWIQVRPQAGRTQLRTQARRGGLASAPWHPAAPHV